MADNILPIVKDGTYYCPLCDSKLNHRQGVSTKTKLPYDFWGCSNWRDNEITGTPGCKYTYNPNYKPKTQQAVNKTTAQITQNTVIDLLNEMNNKLDEIKDALIIPEKGTENDVKIMPDDPGLREYPY